MNKKKFSILLEVLLIVVISAVAGITWNRTLLASAWRGQVTQQAQAAPATEKGVDQADAPMPVALAQVKDMLDAKQAVVIDARSTALYAEGHIAGAMSLPLEQARKNAGSAVNGRFPKESTIIAYCNGFSCHDSMELGKLLQKAGYSSVYVYEGGFPEWQDAGYPVARGER
jgi:rhodanese-related sulfurtransferase